MERFQAPRAWAAAFSLAIVTILVVFSGSDKQAVFLQEQALPSCRAWRGGKCILRVESRVGQAGVEDVLGASGGLSQRNSIAALSKEYTQLTLRNSLLEEEVASQGGVGSAAESRRPGAHGEESSMSALKREYAALTRKNAQLQAKLHFDKRRQSRSHAQEGHYFDGSKEKPSSAGVQQQLKEFESVVAGALMHGLSTALGLAEKKSEMGSRKDALVDAESAGELDRIAAGEEGGEQRLTGAEHEWRGGEWGFPYDERKLFLPEAVASESGKATSGKESSREAEPYYGSKEIFPQEHLLPDEGKDSSQASVIGTNETAKTPSHSAVAQPAQMVDVQQSPDNFLRNNGNGYEDEFRDAVEKSKALRAAGNAVRVFGGGDEGRRLLRHRMQAFFKAFGSWGREGEQQDQRRRVQEGLDGSGSQEERAETGDAARVEKGCEEMEEGAGGREDKGERRGIGDSLHGVKIQSVDGGSIVPCGWPQPPCGTADGMHGFASGSLQASRHAALLRVVAKGRTSHALMGGGARLLATGSQGKDHLDAILQQPLSFRGGRDETDDADEAQPLL